MTPNKIQGIWCSALIAFGSASCSTIENPFDRGTHIGLEQIPATVISAAEGEAPGIDIRKAEIEKTSDAILYEIEGATSDREYEIMITSDGRVRSVAWNSREEEASP